MIVRFILIPLLGETDHELEAYSGYGCRFVCDDLRRLARSIALRNRLRYRDLQRTVNNFGLILLIGGVAYYLYTRNAASTSGGEQTAGGGGGGGGVQSDGGVTIGGVSTSSVVTPTNSINPLNPAKSNAPHIQLWDDGTGNVSPLYHGPFNADSLQVSTPFTQQPYTTAPLIQVPTYAPPIGATVIRSHGIG